jgi:glycosyltransferase involved in cell wall biosynthesis
MTGRLLNQPATFLRGRRTPEAGRPLRVGFLIDRLCRGGTETQLLALIRELDRSRFTPSLFLLNGEDDESRALESDCCPVYRLGFRSFLRPRQWIKALRLAGWFRRQRLDVLQVYFQDSVYLGVPVARLAGVRRVVRVRNNLGHFLTPKHRLLMLLFGRLVDRTLTNCEPAREALLRAEWLAGRRVEVLENGVDLERFPPAPPPDPTRSTVRVGLVGNLRAVKGIDLLVQAAAALRERYPRLTYEVAGEGPERPALERLIAGFGLADCFRLVGSVADVPGFLARQDIAVLCSRAEGMSNAVLEYMAAGRAVVVTDVGANAQLVRHGETGLVVPPGDAGALAGAIARLLDEPGLAVRLAEAARRRVQHDFSRAAMVRRFEGFYEGLCGPARSPLAPL